MAEPMRTEQANELLREARRAFSAVPDPVEEPAPEEAPEKRVRMYRGQPVADAGPAGGRRSRTYRGAPIADGDAPRRSPGAGTSMTAKLRQLQSMRDAGVIDAEEFNRLKSALLSE